MESVSNSLPVGIVNEYIGVEGKAYILFDHMGMLIGTYANGDRAVDRAIDEVCKDYQYNHVHVEVHDYVIHVTGDLGDITILVEDLL